MDTLLSVKDLSVTYGSGAEAVAAVRGVSIDIAKGEIFGLAGESGSGKSTLGLSVLRLLPESARITGEVKFGEQDLLTARWSAIRAVRWAGISMVFQGAMSGLNPVQTIGDQICEPILLHDRTPRPAARERAMSLLEDVGVGGRRFDSYPHELSGGQRQRVMIAMALACNPDLIVADEPTTALDVMVQAQVLRLLTELVRAQGISVILISHDLSVLSQTCDRSAVMYAGQLVEMGPAKRVFTQPRHPYSLALSRAFPTIGDRHARMNPAGLAGDAAVAHLGQVGCAFAPRCEFALPDCSTITPVLDGPPGESVAACLRLQPDYPPRAEAAATGEKARADTGEAKQVILAARNVELVYPARGRHQPARAVDGVDLQIRSGEILALIGESGCGKSSLARTLVGLTRPTAGTIDYLGSKLSHSGVSLRSFRRGVQLVLQDPVGALNPRQRVEDAVAEGLRLHHAKVDIEARTLEAMRMAGLQPPEKYLQRYPHEMSGGQLQRVVIAGALTLEPSVLVADEPVSSLDASARGEILALFLKLRDELGLAALVVSHDLGLAWNVADRVAVMYLGRIVELGEAEQVLLAPQHPYTAALLSVVETGGGAAQILAGEGPDPTQIPAGCRFHPRCPLYAGFATDDPRRQRCSGEDPLLHRSPNGAEVACHFPAGARGPAEPEVDGGRP